jgi:uncharacterized protein (TIGR00730 family)
MPNIAVFGGSQLKPGDKAYENAYELGKQLGQYGYTVLTGGYIGSMEAVSRGAAEAGAHVIGVTCADIEAWRPVGANPWVIEEIRMKTLPERILSLIENCDGALALPGGVGTLTEIMMTWNLLLTNSTKPRPLILVGREWQDFLVFYIQTFGAYIPENQRGWISSAQDVATAVRQLRENLSSGKV